MGGGIDKQRRQQQQQKKGKTSQRTIIILTEAQIYMREASRDGLQIMVIPCVILGEPPICSAKLAPSSCRLKSDGWDLICDPSMFWLYDLNFLKEVSCFCSSERVK